MCVKKIATDFELYDHENRLYRLGIVLGENGLLLGFTSDIRDLNGMRRLMWLRRQVYNLAMIGIHAALIIPDESYMLSDFYISSLLSVPFPMLADPAKRVHEAYAMHQPGLLLIDRDRQIQRQWLLDNYTIAPPVDELMSVAQDISRSRIN